MEKFKICDTTNEIMRRAYRKSNYRVWDRDVPGKKCLMLFSGNGLYFPDTQETFEKVILTEDRYEYQNLAKSKNLAGFSRIIFVRDIYKQWYITGLNEECPDVNHAVKMLTKITEGYTLTTAGNSAGGYAAVLFGILLKAEKIFTFSGQFSIAELSKPFIDQFRNDPERSCYYNLCSLIQSRENCSEIYYFWPNQVESDRYQHSLVSGIESIRMFEFVSNKHELTILPFQIPWILNCNEQALDKWSRKYQEKSIHAWAFLIGTMGLWKASMEVLHYIKVKWMKRGK